MFVLPLCVKNVCPPLNVKMFVPPLLHVRNVCPPGDKQNVTDGRTDTHTQRFIYIDYSPVELSFVFLDRVLNISSKFYFISHFVQKIAHATLLKSHVKQEKDIWGEPQHFFVVAWQNCDLWSSKECFRQMLYNQIFTYFQNIGFVAQIFEASKFLHKCEPSLWSIVNCRRLSIYDRPLRASTFTKEFGSFKSWSYKPNILKICKKLFE